MEYANMSTIVPFTHLILPSAPLLIFCHILNLFNLIVENALNLESWVCFNTICFSP